MRSEIQHATLIVVACDSSSETDFNRAVQRGIVVCPLRFEYQFAAASDLKNHADIFCCGPGRNGVEKWFDEHQQTVCRAPWVMLVGLAGAIDPAIETESAFAIAKVIDQHGVEHQPSMMLPVDDALHAAITCSDTIIATREERIAIARATNAQLVDQESLPFAQSAERFGVRWGIVRGVSDSTASALPRGLESWVNESGQTKLSRVITSLLRRPSDLLLVIELGKISRSAMRRATALADELARLNHRVGSP